MGNIDEVLTRGVVNIIPNKNDLEKVLKSGKKLNIYLGIDPTSTRIHLGHTVPLRKLQALSQLNHRLTFLIGDFTALIGDTSDKESERPVLSKEEIRKNFKTYKNQAGKVLDFSNIKLRYNSEWLKKLSFEDIVKLTRNFSLGDFISRELIKKRLDEGKRVRLDEVLYPVMQGYDSYYMDTDIQIGSADQTFNMQAGRALQKNLRNKESYVLVTDYIMGTDGRKMSKSWGNAIWVDDPPNEMFGKIMSIPDEQIIPYMTLVTDIPMDKIGETEKNLKEGKINPIDAKKELAMAVVTQLHTEIDAEKARNYFEKTFQKGRPKYDKTWSFSGSAAIADMVADFVGSKSEAKRLISQGGVDVDEKRVDDPNMKLHGGEKVRVGKKDFVTVVRK